MKLPVEKDFIRETKHNYELKLNLNDRNFDYRIPKEDVYNGDRLLWWVAQLSAKRITSPQCIYFFMKAVCRNTDINFGRNEFN